MDFFQIIEERRSVRNYLGKPVGEESLQQILAAANQSPSAGNLQGYEIFVVRKAEQRQALVAAAGGQWFIAEAPIALVFCANPSRSAQRYHERGGDLYSVQDATIACTVAMLAAAALGLSTVWVGAFDEQLVRQALGIAPDLVPVAVLPVGYAAKRPEARPRRLLTDIVHEV